MKLFLFFMFSALTCNAHFLDEIATEGQCQTQRPEMVHWIVKVTSKDENLDYCYGGTENLIGFPCDINGKTAQVGSQVSGYTYFRCIDIGRALGYIYGWFPYHRGEKIL